jgi:hypothetical protein
MIGSTFHDRSGRSRKHFVRGPASRIVNDAIQNVHAATDLHAYSKPEDLLDWVLLQRNQDHGSANGDAVAVAQGRPKVEQPEKQSTPNRRRSALPRTVVAPRTARNESFRALA